MSQLPSPVEVFCSYAHEDEQQLQKLEAHLSLLKRQRLIATWHDRHIKHVSYGDLPARGDIEVITSS